MNKERQVILQMLYGIREETSIDPFLSYDFFLLFLFFFFIVIIMHYPRYHPLDSNQT